MAILTIRQIPDPVLRTPAHSIVTVTPEIRQLAHDMIETMYAASGVGLAANQIGHAIQLFVASADQRRGRELVLLNPVILSRGGRLRIEEGCLSLPGIGAVTPRSAVVTVKGLTLDGQEVTVEGRDLLARIFQHEIDHLHGRVYMDRLSWLARQRLLRQYRRQRQALARVSL